MFSSTEIKRVKAPLKRLFNKETMVKSSGSVGIVLQLLFSYIFQRSYSQEFVCNICTFFVLYIHIDIQQHIDI